MDLNSPKTYSHLNMYWNVHFVWNKDFLYTGAVHVCCVGSQPARLAATSRSAPVAPRSFFELSWEIANETRLSPKELGERRKQRSAKQIGVFSLVASCY